MLFPTATGDIPYLTTDQMREVDRAMVEDYHIELIQMMENAGRNLARLAVKRFLGDDPVGKRVVILAGKGGNGGGALVCARWLHNHGVYTSIVLGSSHSEYEGVPAHQLRIVTQMDIPIITVAEFDDNPAALVVDGLIGYSLEGNPHGTIADLIHRANQRPEPILSLDVPSGVDTTTGRLYDPAVKATATMTLALPKAGLRMPDARSHVGELYLADIGVPPALYAMSSIGIQVDPIFARSEILRLY